MRTVSGWDASWLNGGLVNEANGEQVEFQNRRFFDVERLRSETEEFLL